MAPTPYVLDRPDELGGSATVRLRVPHGTAGRRRRPARRPRRRAARRPRRDRRGDRDRHLVPRDVHGRQPDDAISLAARRRQRRVCLGQRSRAWSRTTWRTRTTSSSRPIPAGRSGTSALSSTRSSPTASRPAGRRPTRPAWAVRRNWDEPPTGAERKRSSSSTAATSAGSKRGSTTSRSSAPTCST